MNRLAHAIDRPRAKVNIVFCPGLPTLVRWSCEACRFMATARDLTPMHWHAARRSARNHMVREHGYQPIPGFRPLPRARRRLGAVVDLRAVDTVSTPRTAA